MSTYQRIPRKPAKHPFLGCWQRGYAAAVAGLECVPPYRTYSHHGGTWGYQACRAWREGYEAGSKVRP